MHPTNSTITTFNLTGASAPNNGRMKMTPLTEKLNALATPTLKAQWEKEDEGYMFLADRLCAHNIRDTERNVTSLENKLFKL